MKNLNLIKNSGNNQFFGACKYFVVFFLWSLVALLPSYSNGQTVVVTGNENNIPIQEVRYMIDGQELVQTSPEGNVNPSPEDLPVIINSIELEEGNVIFATTRNPSVHNPNPVIGGNEISPSSVQIVRSDNTIISHNSPEFFENLEMVVSTPDIRSYWDINSQPSIPRGEQFVDLVYNDQVVTSGYLLYTERNGNSETDFIALGRDGEPIEGANVIQVRGFQWNTGINHITNVPTQTQYMVLFSPILFESSEPIYGIRIIAVNEPDGKMVFFVNALSATPDLAERVNSELGEEAVLNIFDNDELNGFSLNPIDVTLDVLEPFPANTVEFNSDGTVDVPPNTAPGVYTMTYEITTAGGESDTAEVRIEVIEYKPEAFDESAGLPDSFGQDSIINVLANDMLNGLPALIENLNLTVADNPTNGALILNLDGSVDVAEGTPAGTYQLTYQICDKADPAKCDQGMVTITVDPTTLTAVNDEYENINLNRGGIIGNVIVNDLLNGESVEYDRVIVELVDSDGLVGVTISEEGILELPSGLPQGDYVLQYDLKETINPDNSDRGEIRFILLDIQMEANDDEVYTNQNQGIDLALLDNDFLNTGELLPETLVIISGPENGDITLNENGSVTYVPETNFSGQDEFTYEICENTDRQFCDQALVSILVRPIELSFTKTPNVTESPIGGLVTYTIELINNSEFTLENLVVKDELPGGLMYLSALPEPESANTWIVNELGSGSSISIVLETMSTELGQVVNTASVEIGEYFDQVAAGPVSILAKPVEVSVSKTSFGIDVYEGNEFEYEIRLINNGNASAENITLQDQLPDDLVYLSFSTEGLDISPDVSGNVISWMVPSLNPGEELVFRIKVQATQEGTIANTVGISLSEDQENLSTAQEATDSNQVLPFFVPNVITPGTLDGKNDNFEIRGIQNFAGSFLTIMNRNGDHVYESDDYQNDWAAQGLNAGSYFYVLVITDSQGIDQTYKGWIQVVK
ncbi:MAG: gliding motility-associated C-terminal domain-containing protein [Cyclobacteriaceae bacterium]